MPHRSRCIIVGLNESTRRLPTTIRRSSRRGRDAAPSSSRTGCRVPRLKRLEDAGIVERRFYEQHPPRAEYVMTEKGKDLRPVLRALLDWGQHHTKYPATAK